MDENTEKTSSPPASPGQGGPAQDPVSFKRNDNPLPAPFLRLVSFFSKRTLIGLFVLVLVIGVGATIIAVQRSTEYRQRASTVPPAPGGISKYPTNLNKSNLTCNQVAFTWTPASQLSYMGGTGSNYTYTYIEQWFHVFQWKSYGNYWDWKEIYDQKLPTKYTSNFTPPVTLSTNTNYNAWVESVYSDNTYSPDKDTYHSNTFYFTTPSCGGNLPTSPPPPNPASPTPTPTPNPGGGPPTSTPAIGGPPPNSSPAVQTGTIQGYKVLMPGNDGTAVPPASETVSLDNPATKTTTANPYSFTNVSATGHYVSVSAPSGYSIGYTLCYNATNCHSATPTPEGGVIVNVPAGGYADLWWHYTPYGFIQGRICKDDNGDGNLNCTNESFIRDPSSTATGCTNYTNQDGVSISITGPQNIGSLKAVGCNTEPYYSSGLIPPGKYTVSVNPPAGWTVTGANNVSVDLAPGGHQDPWFAIKPPPADVNRNGKIDTTDFTLWLRAVKGLDKQPDNTYKAPDGAQYWPDINGNGKIDTTDFTLWLKAVKNP
ncbi:MAG: hypothetical protein A2958_02185 [Candidatus Levybacteria bacterium RIFCSPLOWO2_01_FULL_38_13]|nr:MAG: hypothetical protein A2629_03815 [Candidatus Levybacteria bacterium RIFCSPHIGHO2_01_FULL_41_15]OGH35059.1 MAG: hypothetical protein A2958_02185 [Candidatus Levybacteria bacterium RIFCSPLOWO2_01_FULL_38_13]